VGTGAAGVEAAPAPPHPAARTAASATHAAAMRIRVGTGEASHAPLGRRLRSGAPPPMGVPVDAAPPDPDRMPLAAWEDAIGRMAAHRLRARATDRLADGSWDGDDLEDAIGAAESRATARQRILIWEALTGDPVLSALAAGA